MKQTAVDWLVKEFNLESYKATIALAKEVEKQQIIDAYNIGFNTPFEINFNTGKSITAEQYYSKTYENKENI